MTKTYLFVAEPDTKVIVIRRGDRTYGIRADAIVMEDGFAWDEWENRSLLTRLAPDGEVFSV